MLTKELEHLLETVEELPFVDQATVFENDRIMAVTLSANLARLLPVSRCVLTIPMENFSIEAVYACYQQQVIEYLQKTLELAEELRNS
jgi:hypothetical protein